MSFEGLFRGFNPTDYFKALSEQAQALADLERAVGMEIPPATASIVNGTK